MNWTRELVDRYLAHDYTIVFDSIGDMKAMLQSLDDERARISSYALAILRGMHKVDPKDNGIIWGPAFGFGVGGPCDESKTIQYEEVKHLFQKCKVPEITKEEFEAAFEELIKCTA